MNKIDARGLSCPEPVILTKKALAVSPEGLEILVDNETSKINVARFLKIAGYNVKIESRPNGEYSLSTVEK
jgi:TusA-related sulfurtransferase